jgi:mRNA interferase MazF
MDMVIARFGVYLVTLDPSVGSEMAKTRPCVVVSPDEMNRHLNTVIIAPLTSTRKRYPTRVGCRFGGKSGEIALDQIRTTDRGRFVKNLGRIGPNEARRTLQTLQEMFAP